MLSLSLLGVASEQKNHGRNHPNHGLHKRTDAYPHSTYSTVTTALLKASQISRVCRHLLVKLHGGGGWRHAYVYFSHWHRIFTQIRGICFCTWLSLSLKLHFASFLVFSISVNLPHGPRRLGIYGGRPLGHKLSAAESAGEKKRSLLLATNH